MAIKGAATAERERDLERIRRAALNVQSQSAPLSGAARGNADLRQAAERLRRRRKGRVSFLETPAWVIAIREMAASMAGYLTAAGPR
jgi:hypothetical protein